MYRIAKDLDLYDATFSGGFPTEPLAYHGVEWIKEVIYKCIEANKDVEEMGYLEEFNHFYKKNPTDKMWWVTNPQKGLDYGFSFDKKKIYNLFADYPHKLTAEEKEIFDAENPHWKEFFSGR